MDFSKSKLIVFRLEASARFGTGHLMRCINLASFFPSDLSYVFLLKKDEGQEEVLAYLQRSSIDYELIPGEYSYVTEVEYVEDLLIKLGCKIFVTDLAHSEIILNQELLFDYHKQIKQHLPDIRIVSIEDARVKAFSSDTVVVPNAPFLGKNESIHGKSRVLRGLHYFIFNKNFSLNYKGKKEITSIGTKLLVCLGGSDPQKATEKIVNSLLRLGNEVRAKVICGPAMEKEASMKVAETCRMTSNLECIGFTDKFPELVQWADVCIVGEGLVKFDAVVFGVPSILITQFDHESEPILFFINTGSCVYAGKAENLIEDELAYIIKQVLEDTELRKEMSEKAKRIIDFYGGERVFEGELKPYL